MSVKFEHSGIEDDFSWRHVESGVRAALREQPGDWRVLVQYSAETETLTFITVSRDGVGLLAGGQLSIEKARQAERMNAANILAVLIEQYLRETLARKISAAMARKGGPGRKRTPPGSRHGLAKPRSPGRRR